MKWIWTKLEYVNTRQIQLVLMELQTTKGLMHWVKETHRTIVQSELAILSRIIGKQIQKPNETIGAEES